jgi:hypothetical protein
MIIEEDMGLYLHSYRCAGGCTSQGNRFLPLTANIMFLNAPLWQYKRMAQIRSVENNLILS